LKSTALASILTVLIVLVSLAHGWILVTDLPHQSALLNSTGSSPPAILEVWNPILHSSNITSTTLFSPGSQFSVGVNVTAPGQISGFDVTLNYNITGGPNILQAVRSGSELSGGLFDPNNPPAGCSVLVARNQIDFPAGRIRFAAVMLGGCFATGTGTLFTLTFRVTGTGTSFIDIVRTSSSGTTVTSIVSAAPTFSDIPYLPVDARFQNVPGIPPIASFDFTPGFPAKGEVVSFSGGKSYDPDNIGTISKYLWIFGDGTVQLLGANQNHTFVNSIMFPAAGNFTVTLIVWDSDDNLPGRLNAVVIVDPGIGDTASSNWSGYAIAARSGMNVTDVKGSWIVPSIVGPCGATEQHSSFWVGIDGFRSPTVEQIGTESSCVNGAATYFAWYEFYPKYAQLVHQVKVNPGDTISAEVKYASGKFNLTITNVTTGKSFSKMGIVKNAQLSSAEWIAEAPSSKTGILQLANFGTVKFGQDLTGSTGTCYATVGGVTGPIGSFGSRVDRITMLDRSFTIKALTSALSPDLSSFVVIWNFAG